MSAGASIQSNFVIDPLKTLQGLRSLGIVRGHGGNSSNNNKYKVLELIDSSDEYVSLSVFCGSACVSTVILMRNETVCRNSPVYVKVDNVSEFERFISSQTDLDFEPVSFTSKSGMKLLHFDIGQCDLCIMSNSDADTSISLITE